MNDVGIDTGWRILHGSPDFFNVTKKFHNALQGASLDLSEQKKRLYLQVNENFARFTHFDHDCHKSLWDFLKGFLLKYDQIVVSSEKYFKDDLPVDQRLMLPAINPLTLKNKELDDKTISKYVKRAGIPTDKPIITQVSRLDPWKDPEGVLEVFRRVKNKVDCRLVFCYNLASDDPEGVQMYTRIARKAKKFVDNRDVLFVIGNNDILVNSIQRFSSVIIQKSIKEGFCLSVTEALWKAKPVVASNVGGLPAQIEDGKNGFLLEPRNFDGFAERIVHLLKNPQDAQNLGQHAKETVRQKFLITRLLSDYLDMLNSIMTS